MFAYTDTRENPWWVVDADDKRSARLNLMAHLLSLLPYEPIPHEEIDLPPRQVRAYERPPMDSQVFVPLRYKIVH
jgi:ureidoglycolate hydrolase